MSTHRPLHLVAPPRHSRAHWPAEHTLSSGQALPQEPQFCGSTPGATQWPLHSVRPGGQGAPPPPAPPDPPPGPCAAVSAELPEQAACAARTRHAHSGAAMGLAAR
ncbi:MAG: hypothetical protein HY744_13405 [Deltaproteobacteria bacterium]|nr:hypothetical protein [Deltaproteobacteria bacterium]